MSFVLVNFASFLSCISTCAAHGILTYSSWLVQCSTVLYLHYTQKTGNIVLMLLDGIELINSTKLHGLRDCVYFII